MCIAYRDMDAKYWAILARSYTYRITAQAWFGHCLSILPILLFSLFAGIIVDKFPKKNILLVTQTVSMILAFTLATLVLTDSVRYEYIIVLALLLGLNNTLDMPTRQAFNIEIVGKEDLMNAIALNSTTFNMARIVGPSIGAVMMAWLGAGWCFLLNGVSFIAVLYGIMQIQAAPYVRKKTSREGVLRRLKTVSFTSQEILS